MTKKINHRLKAVIVKDFNHILEKRITENLQDIRNTFMTISEESIKFWE